jgi:hypothetical protein
MGEVSLASADTVSPNVARGKQCLLALQRLEAKKAIIGQIIDGRLRLLEAASQFEELARPANSALEGHNDLEYWCRSIIGWVCLALSEQPERADTLAGNLEAELSACLGKRAAIN